MKNAAEAVDQSMVDNFYTTLDISRVGRSLQPDWTFMEVGMKLMEEVGELAEAVLVESGKMKHKKLDMEHPVFEESADVMLVVLDLLVKMYGDDMTNEQIVARLSEYLTKKNKKWSGVLSEGAAEVQQGLFEEIATPETSQYNVHILGAVIVAADEAAAWNIIENAPFGAVFEVRDENGYVRPEFIPF
jgi:NTP pyrophosphatase (non-canonical NTP hydrolase)